MFLGGWRGLLRGFGLLLLTIALTYLYQPQPLSPTLSNHHQQTNGGQAGSAGPEGLISRLCGSIFKEGEGVVAKTAIGVFARSIRNVFRLCAEQSNNGADLSGPCSRKSRGIS